MLTLFLVAGATMALGQTRAFRIPVRHADPWAIKAMLEGQSILSPELSRVMMMSPATAPAAGAAAAMSGLLEGGHLIVNATDNSLWWIADRPPSAGRPPVGP